MIKGTPFGVKGNTFCVKGTPFEEKGNTSVLKRTPFGVKGNTFEEKGTPFATLMVNIGKNPPFFSKIQLQDASDINGSVLLIYKEA